MPYRNSFSKKLNFHAVWQAHFKAAWGLQALNQLLEAWWVHSRYLYCFCLDTCDLFISLSITSTVTFFERLYENLFKSMINILNFVLLNSGTKHPNYKYKNLSDILLGNFSDNSSNTACAEGGPRSRVCARLTLRLAPHRH